MAILDIWRSRRSPVTRSISGINPIAELARMQREMDDLFDHVVGDGKTIDASAFAPPVDVLDCGNEVLLRADLPGLEQKDIQIELHDGSLTIRGERKDEHREHKDNYQWTERWDGAFSRTMQLPSDVQRDKIEAQFKNGVLEVHLPKRAEAAPKKIEVKAGQ